MTAGVGARVPGFAAGLITAAVTLAACGGGSARDGTGAPSSPTESPGSGQTATVVVTGDIGLCGSPGVEATALLVDRTAGTLLLAGDIAYMHGAARDFQRCFEPHWGRFRSRWLAVPGNHEYETPGASAYFDYFGDAAGVDRTGYYSVRLGDWLVLMLNSNAPAQRNTAQWEFVRGALESNRLPCTLAVWHHPLFTSGPNGPSPFMRDIWALLDAGGAEVVVSGHDHLYERFARQNAEGRPVEGGLRQFVVGTGGAELYRFVGAAPNSEARIMEFGVIRLTLQPTTYRWEFLSTAGAIADSGGDVCR